MITKWLAGGAGLVVGLGLAGVPARADVYLNETTVRPAGVSESVELYNGGPAPIDVGGWTIESDKGSYTFPPGTLLPPDSYSVFPVGDIMEERGGVTSLIDILAAPGSARGTARDAVAYGQSGSAPLPPAGMSLARAPDAADAVPPPPSPSLDGLVWTIDPAPTFGRRNDAPSPQLGGPVVLNEIDPGTLGGGDRFELYNRELAPVPVHGWTLLNGDQVLPLGGVLEPSGYLLFVSPPGYDLEEVDLLYLFDASGVRVDQLGFHGAPPPGPGVDLQRCPDGAGPYLGFDYLTSGGGASFLHLPATPGAQNCGAQTVPEVRFRAVRWGRLKVGLE